MCENSSELRFIVVHFHSFSIFFHILQYICLIYAIYDWIILRQHMPTTYYNAFCLLCLVNTYTFTFTSSTIFYNSCFFLCDYKETFHHSLRHENVNFVEILIFNGNFMHVFDVKCYIREWLQTAFTEFVRTSFDLFDFWI